MFSKRLFSSLSTDPIVLLSVARTPIGSFRGSLSSFTAIQLGAHAVQAAVVQSGVAVEQIDQVIMGNVLSAGLGQASARQVALRAGLSEKCVVTTINKMCASGMKAIMLGSGLLRLNESTITLVGGFESMSNAPFLLPTMRSGTGYGHVQALDSVLIDGLTDAYDKVPMGKCTEKTAKDLNITREESDNYAKESYLRAIDATKKNLNIDIAPITITNKGKSTVISVDEEQSRFMPDKIASLKPAFDANGTITVFNASKLNDGACAMILTRESHAKKLGLKPIAKILGWGDAAAAPVDFPTAPVLAMPVALKHAGKKLEDMELFELNEAFSTVPLAAMKKLGISHDKVNVLGGAVSMGHPIGCSGARIVGTLISALKAKGKTLGIAAICNGGGGASSIVIELCKL